MGIKATFGFGKSKGCGNDAATDMPLRKLMSIMSIERIDGHAIGKRSTGYTNFSPILPETGALTAELFGGVVMNNPRERGLGSANRDTKRIDQGSYRIIDDMAWKVLVTERKDEIDGIRHHSGLEFFEGTNMLHRFLQVLNDEARNRGSN